MKFLEYLFGGSRAVPWGHRQTWQS